MTSTDRDLMLYVDEELDPARRAEVQSRLDADPDARQKVAALRLAAELVRERPMDLGIADGIADAVMARIAAGDVSPSPATQKVAPSAAANDNSRRIYYLAAAAVAAAAAFMVWGKVDPGPGPSNAPVAVQTARAPDALATPAPDPKSVATADEGPSPDGDLDTGVEVAAVDFGARQGSIFYVPNGAAEAHTTTVVWLADDSAGDE